MTLLSTRELIFQSIASKVIPFNGTVELKIMQERIRSEIVGNRELFSRIQNPAEATPANIRRCREVLGQTQPGTLNVVSFLPGIAACKEYLKVLSQDRTIVTLGGTDAQHSLTYIATGGELSEQAKLVPSADDRRAGITGSNRIFLFENSDSDPMPLRWAVLNCHDYTHADVMRHLLGMNLELLIVVTVNTATRLYWEYALADVHRLFTYVAIVNIGDFGGSAVFAPFRRMGGLGKTQISIGGHIFSTSGRANVRGDIELQIAELRDLKRRFNEHGYSEGRYDCALDGDYLPISPSEHIVSTYDHAAGAPEITRIQEYTIDWNFAKPRVALMQLASLDESAYHSTRYRLNRDPERSLLEERIRQRLAALRSDTFDRQISLDFVIFPEVFAPRSILPTLQEFSNHTGAIAVCGLGYPETENANECAVVMPSAETVFYRKITRSRYDARTEEGGFERMERGNQLIRFVDGKGAGIGVLICYDYSHLDCLWKLNLENRATPLDLVIVICYNPDAELYRSCAIADAHRFYQYVAICNVASFGGSGIFGPLRTRGTRLVLCEAGKATEAIPMTELDLEGLRKARASQDSDLIAGPFMRRPGILASRFS